MISIKQGTKTWSDSKQNVTFEDQQQQKAQTGLTKEQREKHYGGAELDEILNKAADPNWVDPAKNRNVGDKRTMGKDAFLKLFLAQLKHQDPTKPMESYDMAAQLAQFTSLEKLESINEGIGTMNKTQDTQAKNNFDVLKLIGKVVGGDSSKITRADEADVHEVLFQIKGDAQSGLAEIKNANGQVVRSIDLADMKSGKNQIEWNGMRDDGTPAEVGEYSIHFDVKASNGTKLNAETKFEGAITGVNFTAQGPVLMMGKKQVRLSEVKKIFDASQLQKKAINNVQKLEVPKPSNKPQKVGRIEEAEISPGGLSEVGLSREMVEKIKKETQKSFGVN